MKKRSPRDRSTPRRDEAPPPAKPREAGEIVFGFRAAMAVFTTRPGDLARVGFARERRREVEALARWAASHRVSCDELPEDELARVAGSTHHEGLVVLAAPRKWSTMTDFADAMIRAAGVLATEGPDGSARTRADGRGRRGEPMIRARGHAVALDRVRNPYNVGAILRSAAFFGLEGALLGAIAPHPALATDAIRVAEGGAEHLRLARTTDLADTLVRLRGRGLRVIGGESDAKASLFGYPFVAPTVLVLGHEREGLSAGVRDACDAIVSIPGSGNIESLNVGVAASLCIAEMARSRRS